MIEKIALAIDQKFEVMPLETEIDTGLRVQTIFGGQPVTKRIITYTPDYEKTNIKFAHKITEVILNKAKELGEITKIELEPQPNYTYKLIVRGIRIKDEIETEIDVPEHYGEEIKEIM